MVKYEAKVIYEFAQRLYSKAETAIALHTLAGIVLGVVIGYYAGRIIGGGEGLGLVLVIVTVISAFIGYAVGVEKAFWLKLQAQTALCQVKIEENTRNSSGKTPELLSKPAETIRPVVQANYQKQSLPPVPAQISQQTAWNGTCPKCLAGIKPGATF